MSSVVRGSLGVSGNFGGIVGGIFRYNQEMIPPISGGIWPNLGFDTPMALTDAKVRNLKPREKAYKTADYDGLYVLTNPNGSRLWRFKYRIGSKEKLLSLGKYPQVSLQEARTARDQARANLTSGHDPSDLKRDEARSKDADRQNTFSSLASLYFEENQKGRTGIRYADQNGMVAGYGQTGVRCATHQ